MGDKNFNYTYDLAGNMRSRKIYVMDEDGNRTTEEQSDYLSYGDLNWPDQLKTYNGENITYDASGNPLSYRDGINFTWSRGRNLEKITFEDGTTVKYRYNENGLRTYKETGDTVTSYEWDGNTLIREQVRYKGTNEKYDIWYFYDAGGTVLGFEYNFLDAEGTKQTETVYYEKNLQGDVIGLLDQEGNETAAYRYDAWGNITESECSGGHETAYRLNHIGYRGYYRDEETGFYYLQSRYYDSEICRFVNADDVRIIGMQITSIFADNLYCYCNCNPVVNVDPNGYFTIYRSIVTLVLDIGFMWISPYLAPIKSAAKMYAKKALKSKINTSFIAILKIVAKISTKIIQTIKNVVSKIPIWGKRWAKGINVARLSSIIVGATASGTINFLLNQMVANISIFLSVGGFIAGILDIISDRKLNNKITFPFKW